MVGKNFTNYSNKYSGFTLTELLIVVSIIVFLGVLGLISFRSQIFKGNDARRKADIHRITVAVEEYEKDNNCYPSEDLVVCDPGTGLKPYLEKIPCDPVTNLSYYYEVPDGCARWYRIYSKLDNTSDPIISELGCEYGCGTGFLYNYYVSPANAPDPLAGTAPQQTDEGTGGTSQPAYNFYGCIDGTCQKIPYDEDRPGPACDPNYQSATCYDQCSDPLKECKFWNE